MDGVGREAGLTVPQFVQPSDALLARLAHRQHGVVSVAQLQALGLSASGVRKRVAAGRLHRVHRGVYAVGHPRLDVAGRRVAAVLACGPGALLSHRTAADALGLLPSASPSIEISIPSRSGRRRPGIIIHRSPGLAPEDRSDAEGIPCTSVARTLLDLADALDPARLAHALRAAERLRLYDDRAVRAVLARAGGRSAARRLRRLLASYEEPDLSRSQLEREALALFTRAGLPRPLVNASVDTAGGPLEVDFLWPDRALVVEADGFRWHSSRDDFETDRRRDQLLRAADLTVVRVTWRQIEHDEGIILAALKAVQ